LDAAGVRHALVEHHRDVRSEMRLYVSRLFRRQEMSRTVEMRPEVRTLVGDRPPRRQAEDLIPPAVGQDRPPPADEPVQAALTRDQSVPGRR
jgi:hypothetical protein